MDKKDVEVVAPKPQEVKPTKPCEKQIKEYQECLESFSYFWTSCKTQKQNFKTCSEFDSWLESSVKPKK